MKRTSNKLFLCSLTSLAVLASSSVFAEEIATAPSLEGGFSGMLGGFLFVPSYNDEPYFVNEDISLGNGIGFDGSTETVDADYDTGWQAAIGYVFEGTANGIELSYRNFDGSSDNSVASDPVDFLETTAGSNESNQYENWDLMISQFLDVGTHVQMRFLGGISYLSDLDQTTKNDYTASIHGDTGGGEGYYYGLDVDADTKATSQYSGLGPRLGVDARYDFGEAIAGFGIVGGASVAYFLGELENRNSLDADINAYLGRNGHHPIIDIDDAVIDASMKDNEDNQAVTNLRGNLGVDYVYFFDNEHLSTIGLELGYEVDAYLDGVGRVDLDGNTNVEDITFSGPYLNVKGVF